MSPHPPAALSRPIRRLSGPCAIPASAALTLLLAAFPLGHGAGAADLDLPVRGSPLDQGGPACAGERLVLRLRADVAHAAYAEFAREREGRTALRPARLAALSARLAGARLEPEFPGELPGGSPDLTTYWIAHLGGAPLAGALDQARGAPEVVEASPIHLMPLDEIHWTDVPAGVAGSRPGDRTLAAAPNDSLWGISYWLYQVSRRDLHMLEAWDVTRGDSTSVIAILDTGILRWHPDLAGKTEGEYGNLWTNRAERHGLAGIDDDDNGFVDDVWGWDYVDLDSAALVRPGEDWRDEDNDPNDFAVHGTAVAGVAAAMADNLSGTCGVAPGARVMALRIGYSATINAAGIVDLSYAARAIHYAVRNGATVINCSFASVQQPDLSAAVTAAIQAGVLVIVAAGNNGSFHYLGDRNDVISVAASDQNDRIPPFSTRAFWVDLCAPGQSIATTTLRATGTDSIGRRTPYYSSAEAGTSFSSPMVAAAAAMMQTDRRNRGLPPYPPILASLRITETTDNITTTNSGTGFGTGRLNVQRLLLDPPWSAAFPAGALTVGPAAIVPMQSGAARAAYATSDGRLLLMHGSTGDTLALVPLGGTPTGGVAAADLGPGLGVGLFVGLADGRVAGFYSTGAPIPGWPVAATGASGDFVVTPALADLDGDGTTEIVWGGDDGSVWAWHADGSRVDGFPRRAGSIGRNLRVALGDLDGQPGAEIVVTSNNYSVYAFRGDGTALSNWPAIIGDDPTSPVIMRLGSNPEPVVVVAAGRELVAIAANGSVRFRRSLPSQNAQELAAGDLNGDRRDEIVAVLDAPDQIASFDSTGSLVTSRLLSVQSWGAPLIGPLSSSGSQVLFPTLDTHGDSRYYAFTGTLADLRGWPKAGRPSRYPTFGNLDADGATEIAAGSGDDGHIYHYDAGPDTWRPNAAFWTTSRGNVARTGSRLEVPPLTPGDDVPPAVVAFLTADPPGTHEAMVRWAAPADPGSRPRVARYDVRAGPGPIDDSNVASAREVEQDLAPASPGAPESLRVSGLPEGVVSWIAVRSRDVEGNVSPVTVLTVETTTQSPERVGDLRVAAAGDSSLTLAWTASGDDGRIGRPVLYRIRLAESPLDSAGFEAATLGVDALARADAGSEERATVGGLPRGRTLWIALRAVDAAGQASALSNSIAPAVGRLARIGGAALLPSRSPARLPIEFEWQAHPDWRSGGPPTLAIYDVSGRLQGRMTLPLEPSGVVSWDGRTLRGTEAGPGIYFAQLSSGPSRVTTRVVMLR